MTTARSVVEVALSLLRSSIRTTRTATTTANGSIVSMLVFSVPHPSVIVHLAMAPSSCCSARNASCVRANDTSGRQPHTQHSTHGARPKSTTARPFCSLASMYLGCSSMKTTFAQRPMSTYCSLRCIFLFIILRHTTSHQSV